MSEITIKLNGQKKVEQFFARFPAKALKILSQSLYRGAEKIMADSKENFVPVDLGILKTSGHVQLPKEEKKKVTVTMGYGGPAAPYAVIVHEDMQAHHPVGQAKYLETPARKAKKDLNSQVIKDLQQAFEKEAKK